MKLKLCLMLLILPLALAACSGSSIVAIVDGGVAAFEAVIPEIMSLSPAQQSTVSEWTDQGLKVFTDLVDNGVSTGTLQAAVGSATKLATQAGLPGGTLISAASNALNAFIAAAQGATVVQTAANEILVSRGLAAFPAGKTIKLTAKHKAKLLEISKRAHAARDRIKAQRQK